MYDLRVVFDDFNQSVVETEPALNVPDEEELIVPPEAPASVLTEGVMHALNCTYKDYRDTHFDECTEGPSDIYQRPDADPDNTGYINAHAPELYASLNDYTSLEESIENRWVP